MDKKMMIPLLLILGAGAIYMMTRRQTPSYQIPITGNVQRDNTVTTILQILEATTASLPVITKMIQQLNGMNDSQVAAYSSQITAGSTPTHYPDGTPILA